MHPTIHIALKAARRAGDIILRSIDRVDLVQTQEKGVRDFVTEIDRKSEAEIINILRTAYPSHQILGEESGLSGPNRSDCVWIIDPLDGTHNYIRGIPHLCVSIGFQQKGKLEHALIFDPIRQEVFTASRGEGARLNDNKRLRISQTQQLSYALMGTGFPTPIDALTQHTKYIAALLPQIADLRCSGSAALDLAYVAAGRLDAFVEVGLKSWDLAAGALIVKEAGGLVSDFSGGQEYLERGEILAATPKIFNMLLPTLASSYYQGSIRPS